MSRIAATVSITAPLALSMTSLPPWATSRLMAVTGKTRKVLLVVLSFVIAWFSPTVSDSMDARHWKIGTYGFELANILVAFFLGLAVLLIAEVASHLRFGRHFSASAAIGIAAFVGWGLLEAYFMGVCLIGNAFAETFFGKGSAAPNVVEQVLMSRSALAMYLLTALDAGILGVVLGLAPSPVQTRSPVALGAKS